MSTVTLEAEREHRVTVPSLLSRIQRGEAIRMLTAYDCTFARIFDAAGIDVLLVGDSLGNVVQGRDTTLPVSLDETVYHTRMVARGASRALVVADMPFGSYQVSGEEAVRNAVRCVKEGGAHAVKLEGGTAVAETLTRLVRAEIPVMGHVGLTPQAVHRMGGHRVQGQSLVVNEHCVGLRQEWDGTVCNLEQGPGWSGPESQYGHFGARARKGLQCVEPPDPPGQGDRPTSFF